MNRKEVAEHLVEYLLLIAVLCIGYVIIRFVPTIAWKVILIFSLASFYLGYGSYHHFNEKDFRLSLVLEYLAIALVVLISLFVLFG
jgi:hypothetical protein